MPGDDRDLAAWILAQLMREAPPAPSTLDERFRAAAELEHAAPVAPRAPRARTRDVLTREVLVPRHAWSRAHDALTRRHAAFVTGESDDPRVVVVRTTPRGADLLAGFAWRCGP